jgi:hypothetical protein
MAKKTPVIEPHDAVNGNPLMGASTYRMGKDAITEAIEEYFAKRKIQVTNVDLVTECKPDENGVYATVEADWQPVTFRTRKRKAAEATE